LLSEEDIVCFRKLQILVDDEEQSVISAYHVYDGIDRCCVMHITSPKELNDMDSEEWLAWTLSHLN